jgi:hypothetical protein
VATEIRDPHCPGGLIRMVTSARVFQTDRGCVLGMPPAQEPRLADQSFALREERRIAQEIGVLDGKGRARGAPHGSQAC